MIRIIIAPIAKIGSEPIDDWVKASNDLLFSFADILLM